MSDKFTPQINDAAYEVNEVTLLDESGNEVLFDHVLTFKYEGERYVALLPLDDVDGIGDDEVLILKIDTRDGTDVYVTIENEVLLDEVFDEFLSLLEEMDTDDDADVIKDEE